MPLTSIVMSYKENCKAEGEIMTKFKIAKMYFTDNLKQKEISSYLSCHQNTISKIVSNKAFLFSLVSSIFLFSFPKYVFFEKRINTDPINKRK